MQKIFSLALLLLCAVSASAAEGDLPKRFGKVIALTGKATATKPDGTTITLKIGDELYAGSVLKTEGDASVDLFFRRIGTIFQVGAKSTLSLDKLELEMKNGKLVKRTELSLTEGSMLACIRVLIPESKVLVKTPKTLFHVPGTGMGRFQFTADGSALVGRRSKLTLVAAHGRESVPVSPGQYYTAGATNPVSGTAAQFETFTKKMDLLQNTAAQLTPPPAPEEI